MKKILLLQFRTRDDTKTAERKSFLRTLKNSSTELIFKNAFLDNLNWSDPLSILEDVNGIILGGSGEYDFDGGREDCDECKIASHKKVAEMRPFLEYLKRQDFPTLAICFGHQIIGESVGCKVRNDKVQAKVGSHLVSLNDTAKSDPLFSDLPNDFFAQYGHKDSLSDLPAEAVLLANGQQCLYSALRYGKNVYSLQFHPELSAEDILDKFKSHPDYLPPGQVAEKLVKESPYASKILINFVKNL